MQLILYDEFLSFLSMVIYNNTRYQFILYILIILAIHIVLIY